jgi:hypothetical protein
MQNSFLLNQVVYLVWSDIYWDLYAEDDPPNVGVLGSTAVT